MTRRAVVDTDHPPGRPVVGMREVTATLTALVRSARREFLIFDDPGSCLGRGISEQFLAFADACVRAAGERTPGEGGDSGRLPGGGGTARAPSVTVRRIVPRQGPATLPHPLAWPLPGRARQTETIPFKMVLVDRAVAAIPLDLQLHYNGLMLIRDPVIVQALVRTHQMWWESGEELPTAVLPRPSAPSPPSPLPPPPSALPPLCAPGPAPEQGGSLPDQLRPVLEAILAGLTDEAAATRLGMSARTYSRRVGELLAALGTASRFRAGAEAARRGWA